MTRTIALLVGIIVLAALPAGARASEPSCGPANEWSRACAAAATGAAPLEGTVHAAPSFSYSDISILYRTTEGSLGPQTGTSQYGSWQTTNVNSTGAFRLTLPACSPQAEFGCIGTAYELYAAYHGAPCTEMWYAKLYVGEPDRLPPEALTCMHTYVSIAPLTGGGEGFEPGCKPPTARNCLPGTAATTSVNGSVSHPRVDKPFSIGNVMVAYRTVEIGLLHAENVYGATHYVKPNGKGAFVVTLASCGPTAMLKFGCDGENIEIWSTYDRATCSRISSTTTRTSEWDIACDTRGTLEGSLRAPKPATWQILVRKTSGGSTQDVSVQPDGDFATLLIPGSYRVSARRNKTQCAVRKTVVISIASTRHLLLHC